MQISYVPDRKIGVKDIFLPKKNCLEKIRKSLFMKKNQPAKSCFCELFCWKSYNDFNDEPEKENVFWTKISMWTKKICRLVSWFRTCLV